jgi:periplasmic divalent cation tolerance protein
MSPVEPDICVVLMTAPSADVAASIGRALVEERLAACANIVPAVRSIYAWQGKICDEGEVLCIIKTRRVLFDRLRDRIAAMHPYEVPEIVAIDPSAVSEPYARWVIDCTGDGGP